MSCPRCNSNNKTTLTVQMGALLQGHTGLFIHYVYECRDCGEEYYFNAQMSPEDEQRIGTRQ